MAYTSEQIKSKMRSIPEDVRDAIGSLAIPDTLDLVEQKFGLNIEQIGILSTTINAVLFGDLQPHLFVSTLADSLRVSKETASQIAQEVNNRVFLEVRESLKKIHKLEEAGAPHAHDEPAEERGALLQSIESPEKIPMRARIVQVSTQTPAQKPPVATVPQAETANSTPKTVPPLQPAVSPEPMRASTPTTPPPVSAPAPAPRAPGPDPYRELA